MLESFLCSMAGHGQDSVRLAVAQNPRLPVSMVVELCSDKDPWVRLAATYHSGCPGVLVEVVLQEAKDSVAVASHPKCPVDRLVALADNDDDDVRSLVASHPQTPDVVLRALLRDPRRRVAERVAARARVPMEVIEASSSLQEVAARSLVAPEPVLLALAEGEQAGWVASNHSASEAVVAQVLARNGRLVRLLALANPACTARLLRKYATNERLHEPIAKNPNTPADVLRKLGDADDGCVRSALAANPSTPSDVLETLCTTRLLRYAVSANPGASADLLQSLAKSRDSSQRHGVAMNPSCPASLLNRLAASKDDVVLRGVAANPHPPVDAMVRMVRAGMWSLLQHPNCPPEAFDVPATDPLHARFLAACTDRIEQLEELAIHESSEVRAAVVANPRCPVPVLIGMLGDCSVFLRARVVEVLGALRDPARCHGVDEMPALPGIQQDLPPDNVVSPIDPCQRNRMFEVTNAAVLFKKLGWGEPDGVVGLFVSHLDDARDLDQMGIARGTMLEVWFSAAVKAIRSGELQLAGVLLLEWVCAETVIEELAERPDASAMFTALDLEYTWPLLCAEDGSLWMVCPDDLVAVDLRWCDLVLSPL